MKIKTTLTITKRSSGEVVIKITDETSGCHLVEISLSPEVFANCLLGQAEMECEATVGSLQNIGKQRVTERRTVTYPGAEYDREVLKQWLMRNCQEDGWVLDSYLGTKQSVSHNEGVTNLHYHVYKFVEK